jgi:hypothetical protein
MLATISDKSYTASLARWEARKTNIANRNRRNELRRADDAMGRILSGCVKSSGCGR